MIPEIIVAVIAIVVLCGGLTIIMWGWPAR